MSPYVVPDHVLERNPPTSLTPTFWGRLAIISFDSLDTDSPQSSVIPENDPVAQLSKSPKGSESTITPELSKPVDLPAIPHRHLYFDDGSITFRVRLYASQPWYRLILRYLHRLREFSTASIGIYSVADRGNSRISFPSFPRSKRPPSRPPLPFFWMM